MMRRELRGFARRTLRGLGDVVLFDSLQQLALAAGFSPDLAPTAAAIALAESGGNPSIVGDKTLAPTKGPSIGLWQINIGSKAWPELASLNLYDPQTNASAALRVYQRQGWNAWTTYTSGKYLKYLPAAQQPADQPVQQPPPTLTIDPATGQVLDDTTPAAASAIDPSLLTSSPNYLLLTALGVGAYLLADSLFGD